MKPNITSIVIAALLLFSTSLSAKKYDLQYRLREGDTYSFVKHDTASVSLLMDGLANNTLSVLQTNYSITILQIPEDGNINMMLNIHEITVKNYFNNHLSATLNTASDVATESVKPAVNAMKKLIDTPINFTLSEKGKLLNVPSWREITDNLSFSKTDRKAIETYLNGQWLTQITALTFVEYPAEKITKGFAWQQKSEGSLLIAYDLQKDLSLAQIGDNSYTINAGGNMAQAVKNKLKMGNTQLDVYIISKENGSYQCTLTDGMLSELIFNTDAKGSVADNSKTPVEHFNKTRITRIR